MELVNTSNSNAISPAWLSASTDPVPKNDLDTVISVDDKPMHPEMTGAILELAGDFVLLAETTITLIGSDQKRQPEIDEKEASDLARLKNLKADTELTLKGSTAHLDFSEGAMEMKLIKLSLELSALIDKLLKGRMESQKDRNVQIEALNDLLSELRKLEKSEDPFKKETLENACKSLPPDSPLHRISAERFRENAIAAAYAIDNAACLEVQEWEQKMGKTRRGDKHWRDDYADMRRDFHNGQDLEYMSANADGSITYNGKHDGKSLSYTIQSYDVVGWEHWGSDKIKKAYADTKNSLVQIDKDYHAQLLDDKVSLNDLLVGYGVYKVGEKLPVTKEDLEAATEKISSMVNSINSTQSMKMLDIHKFTNGRNEAYDLAVKVNNTKFDSLNALIKMIGER
ncbi:MAG: hypothetical protein JWQ10_3690 [Herbaspirillum sp.]|nr:hypothetical protein [Herbaspirillum sp.]